MCRTILVLDEPLDPAAPARALADRGWLGLGSLPPPEQQAPEDRLLGLWEGPEGQIARLLGDGLVHWLELEGTGPGECEALTRALPCLDRRAVIGLLRDPHPRSALRGVRAARLLGDPTLAPALALLARHTRESVRIESAAVLATLVPALIADGLRTLDEGRRRGRGANPLWGLMEPAWVRRQTLRWLLCDPTHAAQGAAPGVEATLRAALQDPDWEVRAGAMIGVVRRRLRSLGGLVEACVIPRTSRDGPDASQRALLRALRQVGCALLAGRQPPDPGASDSPRLLALARLARLLSEPVEPPSDDAGLLVHALTTPLEIDLRASGLPRGAETLGDPAVASGLEAVGVPGLAAWLGDESAPPIRRSAGPAFLIAREPVQGPQGPRPMEAAAALDWCRRHSTPRLALRLPYAEEWERAVRGGDARRYPWGNGFQSDGPLVPGPWGTLGHGSLPEWAMGLDGRPVRCGPGCTERSEGEGLALTRPLIAPEPSAAAEPAVR